MKERAVELKDIKYQIIFSHHDTLSEWRHYKWIAIINGQSFEYSTGEGHATPMMKPNMNYVRAKKPRNIATLVHKADWLHVPTLEDVLNSIFLDADAVYSCFRDWCDDLGYDNDSIKAKATYEACTDNAYKLKKALTKDYKKIAKYIQNLEL